MSRSNVDFLLRLHVRLFTYVVVVVVSPSSCLLSRRGFSFLGDFCRYHWVLELETSCFSGKVLCVLRYMWTYVHVLYCVLFYWYILCSRKAMSMVFIDNNYSVFSNSVFGSLVLAGFSLRSIVNACSLPISVRNALYRLLLPNDQSYLRVLLPHQCGTFLDSSLQSPRTGEWIHAMYMEWPSPSSPTETLSEFIPM